MVDFMVWLLIYMATVIANCVVNGWCCCLISLLLYNQFHGLLLILWFYGMVNFMNHFMAYGMGNCMVNGWFLICNLMVNFIIIFMDSG